MICFAVLYAAAVGYLWWRVGDELRRWPEALSERMRV